MRRAIAPPRYFQPTTILEPVDFRSWLNHEVLTGSGLSAHADQKRVEKFFDGRV
jgi:hypothetical protein